MHDQVVNDECEFKYGCYQDDRDKRTTIKKMAKNYVVTSPAAPSEWRKKHNTYRAGRSRLFMCMASLMFFVVLVMICTVFLFNNSLSLQPSEYDLKNGDMRQIDVSTMFCRSVTVNKANFSRRITVMSAQQVKRYKPNKQTLYSDVVLLRRDRYWYRSFYLLKGSIVQMRLSSRHSITVYWLKGRRTLDKWTKETSKALKQSFKTKADTFTGTIMRETFKIDDDNNYYMGFASVAGDTDYSEVIVNTSISRVVYDTSSCREFCNATTGKSCHLELEFNSDDIALVEVRDNATAIPMHDFWTVWYCQPRIWFYAAIFGGAFILSNFLLLLIHICVLSEVNKKGPKQKIHEMPSRTENLNTDAVKLRSINTTDIAESFEEEPLDNHIDGHVSDVDDTAVAIVTSANEFEENSDQWGTPPRWSTFLREHPFDEAVTDFNESETPPAIDQNELPMNSVEESCFANELAEHLRRLEPESFVYVGPEETDIDDIDLEELETKPFIDNDDNIEENVEDYSKNEQDLVKRREGRRELRWQPRLSMVTEV